MYGEVDLILLEPNFPNRETGDDRAPPLLVAETSKSCEFASLMTLAPDYDASRLSVFFSLLFSFSNAFPLGAKCLPYPNWSDNHFG